MTSPTLSQIIARLPLAEQVVINELIERCRQQNRSLTAAQPYVEAYKALRTAINKQGVIDYQTWLRHAVPRPSKEIKHG